MSLPDEKIQQLLKSVADNCDIEDRAVREVQLRKWRRLKLLWEGFSRVWYSEVAHDWRVWDETQSDEDGDQSSYDKPINVFRAYLESIIAALSVTVPPIKCFPDDADNTLDLATAKAGDKISQLIYRHNDVSLLWLHALFIYCTEGMTACYSYPKADVKFGTYEQKEYKDETEEYDNTYCSNCGQVIDSAPSDPSIPEDQLNVPLQANPIQTPQTEPVSKITDSQELDEYMPDGADVDIQNALLNEGMDLCPMCMAQMHPEIKREQFIVTRLVGTTTEPKSRICLEVYGGLNVKIPNYARKQADCPYLDYSYETNYVTAIADYKHLYGDRRLLDKLRNTGGAGAGTYSEYDQWARLSPQYLGEYPENVVTVRSLWLRPSAFNFLQKEDADLLAKKYPNGCKVVFINECFASAENESLDDCWTLSYNPLSDYVHFDPLGCLLTAIQEITNDLISLTLQTIEHGISQTFVDPAVLDFKAYQNQEVLPGGIFPATPKSGKGLADGFHELRTATLSPEVMPFSSNIQSMAQLVSGALPSLFGGTMQGSETASQYSMSRSQALQRLQNTWKMYTSWWKNIFGKVIPMFIKEVQEDERNVELDDDGNFINTFIRKAELEGKIGRIELEANENLPLTWAQINDIVMKLLQNGSPEILKIIAAPENISLIHDALGLTDFYVPGEDSVVKQYDEIKLLLNSEPIEQPPDPVQIQQASLSGQQPQPIRLPSVEIDPIFDVHPIEFEIVRKWATSEAGRQAKTDNPLGYENVLLHGKMHFEQMQMMQPMAPPADGAKDPKKPNPLETQNAPIQGESDVQVTH